MDVQDTENDPFPEDNERCMSRHEDRLFRINDKQHKGELRRQSQVSFGETSIKAHGGSRTFNPYQSENKQHKGELRRQSQVSFGETSIKSHSGSRTFNPYQSESFEIQDDSVSNEREKSRLIEQVLALQSTLDDLSQRVDAVKDENLKLKSENQVLGQYIENLMAASNVFQAPGDPKGHKSSGKSSKKR